MKIKIKNTEIVLFFSSNEERDDFLRNPEFQVLRKNFSEPEIQDFFNFQDVNPGEFININSSGFKKWNPGKRIDLKIIENQDLIQLIELSLDFFDPRQTTVENDQRGKKFIRFSFPFENGKIIFTPITIYNYYVIYCDEKNNCGKVYISAENFIKNNWEFFKQFPVFTQVLKAWEKEEKGERK